MTSAGEALKDLAFRPVTPDRWQDLERLFGERGACGGCWCMWWRMKRSEFERQTSEGRRAGLKAVVDAGLTPGILAYSQGQAVGWCAVAPREDYPALARSRILARIDEEPVWSIVCFFIARTCRKRGLTVGLIKAAVALAAERGAHIVEGYPVDPKDKRLPAASAFPGLLSAYLKAGFAEVARRSDSRPVMRSYIGDAGHEK